MSFFPLDEFLGRPAMGFDVAYYRSIKTSEFKDSSEPLGMLAVIAPFYIYLDTLLNGRSNSR